MPLEKQLNEDLKQAMKSGNADKVGVLRMLNAALKNQAIAKGKDAVLTDEEVMQVLMREAKKRKESIEAFQKGGRPEMAEKERAELALLEIYLPKQMSREEVAKKVDEMIVTLRQAQGDVVFNNVMKAVMQELKGKADGKMISEIVRKKLG